MNQCLAVEGVELSLGDQRERCAEESVFRFVPDVVVLGSPREQRGAVLLHDATSCVISAADKSDSCGRRLADRPPQRVTASRSCTLTPAQSPQV
jgi:hypothetical protein